MISLKNLLFQPLTFPLKNGESLHLQSRETRQISQDQVSPDLKAALKKGLITMTYQAVPNEGTPVQAGPNPKPKASARKRRTQS